MDIVAAGVHYAGILTLEGKPGKLPDWQGVDVGPEGDAGLHAVQSGEVRDNPGLSKAPRGNLLLGEELFYPSRSALFLEGELGEPVEIVPEGDQTVGKSLRTMEE